MIHNWIRIAGLVMILLVPAAYTSRTFGTIPSETAFVEQACKLISEGKFEAVDGLATQASAGHPTDLGTSARQLVNIAGEYEQIAQSRRVAQKAAYVEALADLKKLEEPNDVNAVTDANSVTTALSVIAKAAEFADSTQKEQLLSAPYVKETFQNAIDNAASLEVEGKWLEAYTGCYGWLIVIDPNNQGYSDHAQQLLDKASLAMAFEDSPCETSEERFQGVRAEMFARAVNWLNSHYVTIPDYSEMAIKGLQQCKLLAEVISTSSRFDGSSDPNSPNVMTIAWEPKNLAAWSSAVDGLLDEVRNSSNTMSRSDLLRLFERVQELNDATVALPRTILVSQFAEAALAALDPYTVVVWPRQMQDFEQMMTNEFMGIGIEISKQKGLLTVSSLLIDTPAFHSSLDAGDIIEKVNGISTKDMTLFCAAKKIKGPAGTKVRLTVRRPSDDEGVADKVFDVTIVRDKILVPSVRGWQRDHDGKWLYMLDEKNDIGYVRLTSFSTDTALGLEKALRELESQGMRGFIMDLRGNTGGLLDSAVAVVDKFVEDGWIVKRQPRAGQMAIFEYAHRRGTHPNFPMAILINSNSASASEIVAGALADKVYQRAILVGTRTHGKGSVQGITDYVGKGAELKYTQAYYHLPSGQRVESREAMEKLGRKDWGVGPNIEVDLRSDELKKLVEVQRQNDVLVKADREDSNEEFRKHTLEETLAADPQLAVGVLAVRSKLIEAETLARAN
ncbi:MAG: S41 family peptidase [Sedimentisphaerales bacterium]|jgi:carboxyl-terminal processing protease